MTSHVAGCDGPPSTERGFREAGNHPVANATIPLACGTPQARGLDAPACIEDAGPVTRRPPAVRQVSATRSAARDAALRRFPGSACRSIRRLAVVVAAAVAAAVVVAPVVAALLSIGGCGDVGSRAVDPASLPVEYEFVASAAVATDDPRRATTEVTNLVEFAGELWASTSQWMAPAPVGGAILRRGAGQDAWTVALQSDQLRLMGLAAFSVPGTSGRDEVVLAQVQPPGTAHEIRWSVAPDRALASRFELPDPASTVRSFGALVSGDGTAMFFAGVQPTGILAGDWDPVERTIRWSPEPELVVGGTGLDQKVTGFASCGGAIWATVRGTLYRRRADGGKDPTTGGPWQPVWSVAVVNPDNSGLRGVSCIRQDDVPAILLGVEGSGEIVRFDAVDRLGPVVAATPLVATPELDTRALIDRTLRAWGHAIPAAGPGSVGYTIPAYNEFDEIGDGVIVAGVEWSYDAGACPSTRRCQPERTFDAQACLLRRTLGAGAPNWQLRCLAVPDASPDPIPDPVPSGAAIVAVRSIRIAPWNPGELWLAGYDSNFVPALGTGWTATLPLAALRR